MNAHVAVRLLALRRQEGLSQEDLAEKLGVTRQAVSKWERGETLPDTDNLVTLARLYGVSLDDLLLSHTPAEPERTSDETPCEACAVPIDATKPDSVVEFSDPALDAELAHLNTPVAAEPPKEPTAVGYADLEFEMMGSRVRFSRPVFPYPIIITLCFLALGFFWHWWHPTWMLFLTIPLYYTMPDFSPGKDKRAELLKFCFPVLVVIIYLLLGFYLNWWHPTWLIFCTIPLYYTFITQAEIH